MINPILNESEVIDLPEVVTKPLQPVQVAPENLIQMKPETLTSGIEEPVFTKVDTDTGGVTTPTSVADQIITQRALQNVAVVSVSKPGLDKNGKFDFLIYLFDIFHKN